MKQAEIGARSGAENKQLIAQAKRDADTIYGDLAMTPPVDVAGNEMTSGTKDKAQNLYFGLTTANKGLQLRMAQEMVRSLVMPPPQKGELDPRKYDIFKTSQVDGAGRPIYGVRNMQGARVALLPPLTMEQLGIAGAGMPNETPPVRGRKL